MLLTLLDSQNILPQIKNIEEKKISNKVECGKVDIDCVKSPLNAEYHYNFNLPLNHKKSAM